MNGILRRRRAAMAAKKENHLVYGLYSQAIESGDYVDTGMSIWKSGQAVTVLLDFQQDVNPSGTNVYGRNYRLLYFKNTPANKTCLSIGKKNQGDNRLSCFYMAVEHDMTNTSTATGRQRICVTHEANSKTVNIKYKKANGTLYEFSYSETFTAAPDDTFKLGASADSAYSLPPGTITKAEIYDTILDSAAIDAFFA